MNVNAVDMESLLRMKAMIERAEICLITNNILDWPLRNESLRNQWIDNKGNIWFLFVSSGALPKYTNGNMEVFYSDKTRSQFLSLVGTASISRIADLPDQSRLLYQGIDTNKMVDVPLQVVKFSPKEGHCWDDDLKDMVPFPLPETVSMN